MIQKSKSTLDDFLKGLPKEIITLQLHIYETWILICKIRTKKKDHILYFLPSGARWKVCLLVNRLLKLLGEEAEIDDELYQKIYDNMLERLKVQYC